MITATASQHENVGAVLGESMRCSAFGATREKPGFELLQQRQCPLRALQLLDGALPWRFVGAPADRARAVADASGGDLVERDLQHELPFEFDVTAVALRVVAPAARRIAGRAAGEPRLADMRLEAFHQRNPISSVASLEARLTYSERQVKRERSQARS